jgi:hypothetical protein
MAVISVMKSEVGRVPWWRTNPYIYLFILILKRRCLQWNWAGISLDQSSRALKWHFIRDKMAIGT